MSTKNLSQTLVCFEAEDKRSVTMATRTNGRLLVRSNVVWLRLVGLQLGSLHWYSIRCRVKVTCWELTSYKLLSELRLICTATAVTPTVGVTSESFKSLCFVTKLRLWGVRTLGDTIAGVTLWVLTTVGCHHCGVSPLWCDHRGMSTLRGVTTRWSNG